MDIAVSIVNRNSRKMLEECLLSLLTSDINEHSLTFYVWDNDSTDGAREYWNTLEAQKVLHYSPSNQGIVGPRIAIGNSIMRATHTHMLEIHSDMKFPKSWFSYLIDGVDEFAGIIMPFILNGIRPGSLLLSDQQLELLAETNRENINVNNCLQVHPWLVNVDCMREVGYYRHEFVGHICEDDDFVWRVRNSKYKIRATKKSIVQHVGGASGGSSLGNVQQAFQLFEHLNGISRDEYCAIMRREGGHPIIPLMQ